MLSKLLKYELRASGRILLPVYALLLASAGCCSLFYKLAADHPYRTGAASVLMGLLMMAFWVVLVNLLGDLLNQRLDPRLRLTD